MARDISEINYLSLSVIFKWHVLIHRLGKLYVGECLECMLRDVSRPGQALVLQLMAQSSAWVQVSESGTRWSSRSSKQELGEDDSGLGQSLLGTRLRANTFTPTHLTT